MSAAPPRLLLRAGPVELERQSEFSLIRVRRRGDVRTLIFVRDDGSEAGETMVDLKKPHLLLAPYTRVMFANYLVHPQPQRVLIVGLGGGAMVHFLRRHDPAVSTEPVEIDPAVVKIAREMFLVPQDDKVNLVTADAFEFLKSTKNRYDVIYMDAFLKPSGKTDLTGAPLKLKTREFYQGLRERLTGEGLVVVNLNHHAGMKEDAETFRAAMTHSYVFRVPGSRNQVLVGGWAKERASRTALRSAARKLDRRFDASFSFQQFARLVK